MRNRVSMVAMFALSMAAACGYDPHLKNSGLNPDGGGGGGIDSAVADRNSAGSEANAGEAGEAGGGTGLDGKGQVDIDGTSVTGGVEVGGEAGGTYDAALDKSTDVPTTTIDGGGDTNGGETTGTGGAGGLFGTGGIRGSGGGSGPDTPIATGGTGGVGGITGTGGGNTTDAPIGTGGSGGTIATGGAGGTGTGGTTVTCVETSTKCSSNSVQTCTNGQWVGMVDCGLTGQICNAGMCQTHVCTPSTNYCDANVVRACSSDGMSSTLITTCATTEYCDAISATCKAQVCAPNQPTCDGKVLTTCNANGSGYTGSRTDCTVTPGQICSAGTCKTQICTPSAYYCDANAIRLCSSDGLSSTLYAACDSTQFCDKATATCKPQVCPPNQMQCNVNVLLTCNADGSGYTGTGVDCAASGQSCVQGECIIPVVVDTIDPSPTIDMTNYSNPAGPYTKVNYYAVSTARTLQKIELYMNSLSATSTLTWVVYEATTQTSSSYTIVSSTTTTPTLGEGYQSSGTLSVPLKAGFFYAIGVSWTIVENFWYHSTTASFPIATSFGSLISGYAPGGTGLATVPWNSSATLYYPQRISTIP